MRPLEIVAFTAAVISAGMGVLAIVAPNAALKLVGLLPNPTAPHAISEVRATFGGLFLAMSAVAIATGEPLAFLTVGAGWFGAGAVRAVSMVVDRVPTAQNAGAAVFESGLGLAMLAWAVSAGAVA